MTFHHSASTAFAALIDAWPLPAGGRIGVVPSEFGSNAMVLAARAARDGIELVDLPVDGDGRIDLARLGRSELAGLDLVTFPHVPSQRGIVQPAAEVAARAAAGGVPLLLDVAQSLGQVPTTGIAAAAYVGTSRKWLCGPRGVGILAVQAHICGRLTPSAPSLHTATWDAGRPPDPLVTLRPGPPGPPGAAGPASGLPRTREKHERVAFGPLAGIARMGIGESAAAARLGLAVAVAELLAAGPTAVHERIAALGALGRQRLDGVAGWQVREPPAEPTGIITLIPPDGVDVHAVRDRLYTDAGILTSAIPTGRAPRDMTGPLLRASPHAYTDPGELEALADALARLTRR